MAMPRSCFPFTRGFHQPRPFPLATRGTVDMQPYFVGFWRGGSPGHREPLPFAIRTSWQPHTLAALCLRCNLDCLPDHRVRSLFFMFHEETMTTRPARKGKTAPGQVWRRWHSVQTPEHCRRSEIRTATFLESCSQEMLQLRSRQGASGTPCRSYLSHGTPLLSLPRFLSVQILVHS